MSGSLQSPKSISATFQSQIRNRKPDRRKRTPPVSIRFSDAERGLLSKYAGDQPLSRYVREFVLRAHKAGPKSRKPPRVERQEIARALSLLGRCELAPLLRDSLSAVEAGRLLVDRKTQDDLRVACDEISDLRRDLMTALGLREPS